MPKRWQLLIGVIIAVSMVLAGRSPANAQISLGDIKVRSINFEQCSRTVEVIYDYNRATLNEVNPSLFVRLGEESFRLRPDSETPTPLRSWENVGGVQEFSGVKVRFSAPITATELSVQVGGYALKDQPEAWAGLPVGWAESTRNECLRMPFEALPADFQPTQLTAPDPSSRDLAPTVDGFLSVPGEWGDQSVAFAPLINGNVWITEKRQEIVGYAWVDLACSDDTVVVSMLALVIDGNIHRWLDAPMTDDSHIVVDPGPGYSPMIVSSSEFHTSDASRWVWGGEIAAEVELASYPIEWAGRSVGLPDTSLIMASTEAGGDFPAIFAGAAGKLSLRLDCVGENTITDYIIPPESVVDDVLIGGVSAEDVTQPALSGNHIYLPIASN